MHRLAFDLGSDPDSPFATATDLTIAGFFYATRSCEVTTTPKPGKTRILQLDGIVFRTETGAVIAHDSPLLHLAFRVTVVFVDQKNKTKRDSRTQERTGDPILCPVTRLSSLVRRIRRMASSASDTTTINTVNVKGSMELLTSSFLLDRIRFTCTFFGGRETFGFSASEIGTKSIRSGAAMALFLMNHSPERIMIMGRWKSTAFLDYIRPQVLEWTNNMSADMIRHDSFLDAATAPSTGAPATTSFNGHDLIVPRFHLRH